MHKIITSGAKYIDIDVLASSLAYYDLLSLRKINSSVHHTGPLNASIIPEIKEWCQGCFLKSSPKKLKTNTFILVDISNPYHLEKFVDISNVTEVFDHHYGFEKFWYQRIGIQAKIESVGACATLIWEEYKKDGLNKKIPPLSANLLYSAIISNTLNFNAYVTSARDVQAFEEIKEYITLQNNWTSHYYRTAESFLRKNLEQAIFNDTKQIISNSFSFQFSQLELWSAEDFISNYANNKISSLMDKLFSPSNWLLSISSICEKCNYLFTNSSELMDILALFIDFHQRKDYWITNRLWMRKEILKNLQSIPITRTWHNNSL